MEFALNGTWSSGKTERQIPPASYKRIRRIVKQFHETSGPSVPVTFSAVSKLDKQKEVCLFLVKEGHENTADPLMSAPPSSAACAPKETEWLRFLSRCHQINEERRSAGRFLGRGGQLVEIQ